MKLFNVCANKLSLSLLRCKCK